MNGWLLKHLYDKEKSENVTLKHVKQSLENLETY